MPAQPGGTRTTRSTPASSMSAISLSYENGSGSCGGPAFAGHGRSGVLACQTWTCESTISRRETIPSFFVAQDSPSAATAPAPSIRFRNWRLDGMWIPLLWVGFRTRCFECCLTTELSGRPQPPLRIGEHAIHCEHDAPAMIHGPLQRVVRQHVILRRRKSPTPGTE